jgi:hypothetical protein
MVFSSFASSLRNEEDEEVDKEGIGEGCKDGEGERVRRRLLLFRKLPVVIRLRLPSVEIRKTRFALRNTLDDIDTFL